MLELSEPGSTGFAASFSPLQFSMNYEIHISYSFSIGRIFIIRNINSVSWGRVMFSCRDNFVCWKSIKNMGHSVHNMSYSLYVSVFTFGFVHASHQSRAQGSWWCFMVSVVQKVRLGLTFLYGTCICARHFLSMLRHGSIPLPGSPFCQVIVCIRLWPGGWLGSAKAAGAALWGSSTAREN